MNKRIIKLTSFIIALIIASSSSAKYQEKELTIDDVRNYVSATYTAVGGSVELIDMALQEDIPVRVGGSITFLDVFKLLIVADGMAEHLQNKEYYDALLDGSMYITSILLVKTTVLGQSIGSAFAIGSLAALPIDLGLKYFAKNTIETAWNNQIKIYIEARNIGMTHEQILNAKSKDVVLFDDQGWLSVVGDRNLLGYKAKHPGNFSPLEVYSSAEKIYDAIDLIPRLEKEKRGVGEAFVDIVSLLTKCGSTWYQRFGLQLLEVEQAIRGGYSFDVACQAHDACYGDCETSRADCDENLYSDAKSVCESALIENNCIADAQIFYSKVSEKGEQPFLDARANCSGTPSLGEPIPNAGVRAGLATALIIDQSGSMVGQTSGPAGMVVQSANKTDSRKLEKAKEAAKAFVLSREENDLVSVSAFSDSANTVQRVSVVNTIKPQIDGILGKINASGATNIGAGLEQGFMQLSNAGETYTKMAVLLSDGENNRGEWQTKAEKFKEKGWPVCTVGFGSDADEKTLRAIAVDTGCIYEFSDISNIVNTFQGINAYASGESTILQTNDALSPQGSISYAFYVTALAKILKIYTSWQGSTLNTVLTSPDGRKIDKQYIVQGTGRYEEGDTFQMLELKNPSLGKWTLEVDWAVPPLVTERVNLMVTEKTDAFVRIHGFRPQYSVGEPVTIKVDVQELAGTIKKIPLINPKISIQVQKPGQEMIRMVQAQSSNWAMYKDVVVDVTREVFLFDDGTHEDYKTGDGIFGGVFTETDKNGAYLVTAKINGKKQNGESVEKTLIGSFQVGPITENQITNSQTLQYMDQAKTHSYKTTPSSNKSNRSPLDAIDELQTDPMDAIDNLLN